MMKLPFDLFIMAVQEKAVSLWSSSKPSTTYLKRSGNQFLGRISNSVQKAFAAIEQTSIYC